MSPTLAVRVETPGDRDHVRRINESAFEGTAEADLVEALHRDGLVLSSLVATVDGEPRGHILFSRMWVETQRGAVDAVCLAPVAVLPSHQRTGIGSALVAHGLEKMRQLGERMVIVVGHPTYYPRFGFEPASLYGITGPFSADAFMVMELADGGLADIAGPVRYPAAFGI